VLIIFYYILKVMDDNLTKFEPFNFENND
jgi:hypothetical protein